MAIRLLAECLLRRYLEPESAPRVLFVLGAGASLESGLPEWNDADLKREIVSAMARAWGSEEQFLEEASASLVGDIGYPDRATPISDLLSKASTDQLCAVASLTSLGRRHLIDTLCKRFPDRHGCPHPQLAYELIAHLLKHGFADYVITLNFDELIDASMGDELGEEGYSLILSNHRDSRRREGVPSLFKLHGTISQQDSLRLTRDTTRVLTEWTKEALDHAVPIGQPLVVVSLGYSWRDVDLAHWLRDRREYIEQMIVAGLDDKPVHSFRTLVSEETFEDGRVKSISAEAIVAEGAPATVDEVLWACWKLVRELAPEGVTLPSAARHLLVSHMFTPPAAHHRSWPSIFSEHNQASRSEAELFLACVKANGMVTISALARDPRVDRWLSGLSKCGIGLRNAQFLKPNEFSDVTEVYFFAGRTEEDLIDYYRTHAGERQSFTETPLGDPWNVRIGIPIYTSEGRLVRDPLSYAEFFTYYVKKVLASDEVEVDPGRRPRSTRFLLAGSVRLPTLGRLYEETQALLASDWTTLLVIAESGRWLTRELTPSRSEGRSVFLIETSEYGLAGWHTRPNVSFPPLRRLYRIAMPWWEHNRHLTLAISSTNELLGGIYFRRRQKTPRISPVLVPREACQDLQELLATFVSYTARVCEMPQAWRGADLQNQRTFLRKLQEGVPIGPMLSGWPGADKLVERLTSCMD